MAALETELMENLIRENLEFKKLFEEHNDLKKKIKGLDKNKLLSFDQEAEVTRLKKLKLKSKDQMHKILEEYRLKV